MERLGRKLLEGRPITVAFLGGSITWGRVRGGRAVQCMAGVCKQQERRWQLPQLASASQATALLSRRAWCVPAGRLRGRLVCGAVH